MEESNNKSKNLEEKYAEFEGKYNQLLNKIKEGKEKNTVRKEELDAALKKFEKTEEDVKKVIDVDAEKKTLKGYRRYDQITHYIEDQRGYDMSSPETAKGEFGLAYHSWLKARNAESASRGVITKAENRMKNFLESEETKSLFSDEVIQSLMDNVGNIKLEQDASNDILKKGKDEIDKKMDDLENLKDSNKSEAKKKEEKELAEAEETDKKEQKKEEKQEEKNISPTQKMLETFVKDHDIDFKGITVSQFAENVEKNVINKYKNCKEEDKREVYNSSIEYLKKYMKEEDAIALTQQLDILPPVERELDSFNVLKDQIDYSKQEINNPSPKVNVIKLDENVPTEGKSDEKENLTSEIEDIEPSDDVKQDDELNEPEKNDDEFNIDYGDEDSLEANVERLRKKYDQKAYEHIKGNSYLVDKFRFKIDNAFAKIKIAGYKKLWKAKEKVGTFAKGFTEELKLELGIEDYYKSPLATDNNLLQSSDKEDNNPEKNGVILTKAQEKLDKTYGDELKDLGTGKSPDYLFEEIDKTLASYDEFYNYLEDEHGFLNHVNDSVKQDDLNLDDDVYGRYVANKNAIRNDATKEKTADALDARISKLSENSRSILLDVKCGDLAEKICQKNPELSKDDVETFLMNTHVGEDGKLDITKSNSEIYEQIEKAGLVDDVKKSVDCLDGMNLNNLSQYDLYTITTRMQDDENGNIVFSVLEDEEARKDLNENVLKCMDALNGCDYNSNIHNLYQNVTEQQLDSGLLQEYNEGLFMDVTKEAQEQLLNMQQMINEMDSKEVQTKEDKTNRENIEKQVASLNGSITEIIEKGKVEGSMLIAKGGHELDKLQQVTDRGMEYNNAKENDENNNDKNNNIEIEEIEL